MSEQVLTGQVLERAPDLEVALPGLEQDLISRLTIGWLWSFSSSHTRRAYERNLREWLEFCSARGQDPLTVTRGHGNIYARMLEQGDPPPSPKTVSQKLAAVSSWYTYLALEDAIPANKFGGASRPKVERGHTETAGLEKSEALALVAAADAGSGRAKLRTAAMVRFMLSMGPRVAEVSSITVGSLGFERGFRTARIVGKGQKVRIRSMTVATMLALDAYLEDRLARSGAGMLEPSAPLFATSSGRPVPTRYIFDLVRRVAREAGLEYPDRVTPHALRHTFATLGSEEGASLDELQEALGHASPETTKIYIHARNRLERDPSQRVGLILG
ncbi:tyrosine-type recombinase/integrase [Streptosporangium sp. NPDC051023]|uniref:tyrosine-type recombinase/integrase n=1 Tax=Streptosporangium sp. NPDC051023 TaxID=3155410 RepID=UPI00344DA0A9